MCSFLEPQLLARAATKGSSALVLGGSEVVAKGLCPYPHVLVAVLRLYSQSHHFCVQSYMLGLDMA